MISENNDTDAIFKRVWERVSATYPSSPLIPTPTPKMSDTPNSTSKENLSSLLEQEAPLLYEPKNISPSSNHNETKRQADEATNTTQVDYNPTTQFSSVNEEASHVAMLQSMISTILERKSLHNTLAKRTNGEISKTFSQMATEDHHYAKRLSVACFLMSGLRYFPEPKIATLMPSYFSTLRNRFLDAQNHAHQYQTAAQDINDPYLTSLFQELSEYSLTQANQIRIILEKI